MNLSMMSVMWEPGTMSKSFSEHFPFTGREFQNSRLRRCATLRASISSRRRSAGSARPGENCQVGFLCGLLANTPPSATTHWATQSARRKFVTPPRPRALSAPPQLVIHAPAGGDRLAHPSPAGAPPSARRLDHFGKALLHMRGLAQLVIAPLEVKAHTGCPSDPSSRVQPAKTPVVRNHLPARMEIHK